MSKSNIGIGATFFAEINDFVKNVGTVREKLSAASKEFLSLEKVQKRVGTEAENLLKKIDSLTKTFEQNAKAAYDSAIKNTSYGKSLSDIGKTAESSQKGFGSYARALDKVNNAVKVVERGLAQQLNKAIDKNNVSLQKAFQIQNSFRDAVNKSALVQKVLSGEVTTTDRGLRNYVNSIANTTKSLHNFQTKTQAAGTTQSNLKSQADSLRATFSNLGNATEVLARRVESGKISYKAAEDALRRYAEQQRKSSTTSTTLSKQVDELKTRFGQFSKQVDVLSKAVTSGKLSIDRMEKTLRKLAESQSKAADEASKFNQIWNSITNQFTRGLLYAAGSMVLSGFRNAISAAIDSVIEYDQTLKNLQAITSATATEVLLMGDKIKDVADKTKFSTFEVGQGMILLGQAGLNAVESVDAIQATAELATGTLTELSVTADLLTTTIRAFGLETIEAGRVADVMANAVNKSKLSVEKLQTAFNYVSATAASAGVSIEQTAATMMLLANNGMKASTIGTGLRQVFSRMLNPNEKLKMTLEGLGVELSQLNPEMVGYEQALSNLAGILWDAEKQTVNMTKAFKLFGLRGAQAASVIIKGFVNKKYDEALDQVFQVGTASNMAAIQAEGLGVMLKNTSDKAKLLAVAFAGSSGLTEAFRTVVGIVRDIITGLTYLVENNITATIIQFGLLTTAVVAVTAGLMKMFAILQAGALGQLISVIAATVTQFFAMARATNVATAAQWALNQAIAVNPYVLAAAAIAAVALAAYKLTTANKKAAEEASRNALIHEKLSNTLSSYKSMLSSLDEQSQQYSATVERFKLENEELAQKITDLTGVVDVAYLSQQELVKAMEAVSATEMKASLEQNIDAVFRYGKEVEKVNAVTELQETLLKATGDGLVVKASKTGEVTKAEASYEDSIRKVVKALVTMVENQQMTTAEVEQYIEAMVDSGKITQEQGDIISSKMEETMERIANSTDRGITKYKNIMEKLPEAYQEVFKELDGIRKADYLDMLDKLNKQTSELKSRYATLIETGVSSESEMAEAVAAVRTKAHIDFLAEQENENADYQENLNAKIDMINAFAEKEIETIIEGYEERMDQENLSSEEILKIRSEMFEELKSIEEGSNDKINSIRAIANDLYKESLKDALDDYEDYAKKAAKHIKKAMDDQVDDLKKNLKKFEDDYEDSLKKIKKAEDQYQEDMRDLRQQTMTDIQKWNDDKYNAYKMLNKAIKTDDADLAKEAGKMFKSLSREVKDENGNVVKTVKQTSDEAIYGYNKSHTTLMKILKAESEEAKSKIAKTKDSIAEVEAKLEKYQKKMKEIGEQTLKIDVTDAKKSLETVWGRTNELAELIGEKKPYKIDFDDSTDGIDTVQKEIEALSDSLQGKENKLIINILGKASPEGPISEKLQMVRSEVNALVNFLKAQKFKLTVDVTQSLANIAKVKAALDSIPREIITKHITKHVGEGSSRAPIMDKLAEIANGYKELHDSMAEGADVKFNFTGDGVGVNEQLGKLKRDFDEYFAHIAKGLMSSNENWSIQNSETLATAMDTAEGMHDAFSNKLESLKDLFNNLAEDYNNANERIIDINKSTTDLLLDIQRETMTDHELYLSKKQEAEEVYNEAVIAMQNEQYETAADLFEKSQDLAKDLVGEVKDESGNTILSVQETANAATSIIKNAGAQAAAAMESHKENLKSQQEETKQSILKTQEAIQSLAEKIEVLANVLTDKYVVNVDVDPAIQAYQELADEAYQKSVDAHKQAQNAYEKMYKGDSKLLRVMQYGVELHYNRMTEKAKKFTEDYEAYNAKLQAITERGLESNFNFTGTGSDKKPVMDKIDEIEGALTELLTEEQTEKTVDFVTSEGKGVSEEIEDIEENWDKSVKKMTDGYTSLSDSVKSQNEILIQSAEEHESAMVSAQQNIRGEINQTIGTMGTLSNVLLAAANATNSLSTGAAAVSNSLRVGQTGYTPVESGQTIGLKGYKKGGMVEAGKTIIKNLVSKAIHFSDGGSVPGYGFGDKVLALLEPGEFVLDRLKTALIGAKNLEEMTFADLLPFDINNAVKMQAGGSVPAATGQPKDIVSVDLNLNFDGKKFSGRGDFARNDADKLVNFLEEFKNLVA